MKELYTWLVLINVVVVVVVVVRVVPLPVVVTIRLATSFLLTDIQNHFLLRDDK